LRLVSEYKYLYLIENFKSNEKFDIRKNQWNLIPNRNYDQFGACCFIS